MLFGLTNLPFVSATYHRSRREFVPEANVTAIGRPKTAYLDVEKNIIKIKVLNGYYLADKMYKTYFMDDV